MQTLLELKELQKHYAAHKAVDGISFTIDKGSIFGLLGPNGAGKTTLLRMITGIIHPDGGQILLNSEPFKGLGDARKIGYMPEERGLYKKMKIGEQALYLAQLRGLSKQEAQTSLEYWFTKLDMTSWFNKKVEDLSKGMSQKLQFVTTVMHNPQLIILDEPFSGLDPVNANLIKEEIFELAQKGATVIFSTHRMEQVEEICSKIVLINLGKKIIDGTVSAIKQAHKQHLFEVQTPQADKVTAVSDLFTVTAKNDTSVTLQKQANSSNNQILQSLIHQGIDINGFEEKLPSLNDIFIQLVEGTHATARAFQTA
jgi:ABC-2 type transport system ATP-binding protein